jgi:penicillin-binding protein A
MLNNKYEPQDNIVEGLTAPRGRILDVNGIVLVDNIGIKSLIYNKLNISNNEELNIIKKLSKIISIDETNNDYNLRYFYYLTHQNIIDKRVSSNTLTLYNNRKINSKDLLQNKLSLITNEELNKVNKKEANLYYLMNKGYSYEDKIIKYNLTEEEYLNINKLNLEGIRTDITWDRFYPYKETLRDVFGNVSSYSEGVPYELKNHYLKQGYELTDRVGINNLEYVYDNYLKGTKAKYKNVNNHLIKIKDAQKGHDIVLSIDINMQNKISDILKTEMIKAKKATNTKYFNQSYIIVSNPNDGSIVSLVGEKINEVGDFIDYSYYNAINSFTMGSVVKGASISVGYKYNLINDKTKILDGCVTLLNQKPKCSWKSLGYLNDLTALKMSSNYFQYLIAIGLTGNKYHYNIKLNANKQHFDIYRNMFKSYGLGNITGIDLTGEVTGVKGTTISDDLLLNFAIGNYDTYTPVELSEYINTIASGKRTRLSLLKYVLNNDGSIYFTNKSKVYNKAPVSDYYLNRIREGFKEVNKNGTGYGYTNIKDESAGKTGTSESFMDTNGDNVIDTRTTTSTYAMFAPINNPRYSIIMVSPNIKYQNNSSNYKYPINSLVMRQVTKEVFDNN